MFSGIITECLKCLDCKASPHLIRVTFPRPSSYKNLKEGDSVSVDGVCLTVEKLHTNTMTFCIGPETLKITQWRESTFQKKKFNLEQALAFHQPVGGHLVAGHVDGLTKVLSCKEKGESKEVKIKLPEGFQKFFWRKAYIALNGASLTVNNISGTTLEVCLIPKTLEKTNLNSLKGGDRLNFEADNLARLFVQSFENILHRGKPLS